MERAVGRGWKERWYRMMGLLAREREREITRDGAVVLFFLGTIFAENTVVPPKFRIPPWPLQAPAHFLLVDIGECFRPLFSRISLP